MTAFRKARPGSQVVNRYQINGSRSEMTPDRGARLRD